MLMLFPLTETFSPGLKIALPFFPTERFCLFMKNHTNRFYA